MSCLFIWTQIDSEVVREITTIEASGSLSMWPTLVRSGSSRPPVSPSAAMPMVTSEGWGRSLACGRGPHLVVAGGMGRNLFSSSRSTRRLAAMGRGTGNKGTGSNPAEPKPRPLWLREWLNLRTNHLCIEDELVNRSPAISPMLWPWSGRGPATNATG